MQYTSRQFEKLNYEEQLEYGRLHAKLPLYKNRVESANTAIAAMQELAANSYLSLSFGKQSLVLAHLLFQVCPSVPCYFLASDESWILHNYAQVIQEFCGRFPINLTIVNSSHVWSNDFDWEESRASGDKDLQKMTGNQEFEGWYWGLTAEESKARAITLSSNQRPGIYEYKSGKFRCCPLWNWGLADLAAYIATHNLPMLEIYHRLGLTARTTARLTKKAAQWGLSDLKRSNLEAFQVLCDRFPTLRSVNRYQ
jgi:3'-phosphoadenosine 5'-phosphosulfate sulfotransferase (PAPS reductase)/FAD synthetase